MNDFRRWAQTRRESQDPARQPSSIIREDADDPRLVHPANEGRDLERLRARLIRWAQQERPNGFAARALERLEPVPEAAPPPPGQPHERPARLRGHRIRGGEPKKHPRPPTMPQPPGDREGFDVSDPELLRRDAPRRALRGRARSDVLVPSKKR